MSKFDRHEVTNLVVAIHDEIGKVHGCAPERCGVVSKLEFDEWVEIAEGVLTHLERRGLLAPTP